MIETPKETTATAESKLIKIEVPVEPGLPRCASNFVICKDLDPLAQVAVGGSSIFDRSKMDFHVQLDFDKLADFFSNLKVRYTAFAQKSIASVTEYLSQSKHNPGITPALWAFCYVYNNIFYKSFEAQDDQSEARRMAYRKGKMPYLSEIIKDKISECAERALLGKKASQLNGFDTAYFGGAIAWQADEEFAHDHCMVILKDKDRKYIWDVANHHSFPPPNTEVAPAIYEVPCDFEERIHTAALQHRPVALIEGVEILTGKKAYFGIHDGVNLEPRHFQYASPLP